eukprot:CAMPEP_0113628768 /NCGR_PEP_ID=MMETSP0017_2-20120614/14912_1 /TAXON_ID=2856 /ORGANISM="Cylindrotheca closterium" /LENGTH=181 /DNA_ID=CAMNT_0000539097 /DNA_START=88 /DNA_END=633 /DNA_ORIENTATION=+ /assembly_acc=CAM_ASM_000147
MGLTTSKQELNPLDYPAIWISEPTMFSDFQTTKFPTEPQHKPVELKDSALWDEFAASMNVPVSKLNQYIGWMYIMYLVVLVMCLLIGIGGQILWVQILTFPIILMNLAGHFYIVKRNQRLDQEIGTIIQAYETRFLPHNIQLEYVTKWTDFCKPRHQRAMRVVLFGPVPNQERPNLSDDVA